MNNAFVVNSEMSLPILKEALYQRTAQARAITGCLLMLSQELSTDMLYDALWAVDTYLEQIYQLQEVIDSKSNKH